MTSFYASTQSSSDKLLAELIRRIRNTNNLTQADFGRLFKPPVIQSTVARWEKGEQIPDGKYFPKIASFLDITFEELLELLENPLIDIDSIRIENKTLIPNKRHLGILKKGRRSWNKWRERNPDVIPQLSGIDLLLEELTQLEGYNLDYANLAGVEGTVVSFRHASLFKANLEKATFDEGIFDEADLTEANLRGITIKNSSFERANLKNANLQEAQISISDFIEANLKGADLQKAYLLSSNFQRAILKQAKLVNATLHDIDFRESNFNEASLEKITITDCDVYGVTFLRTNITEVKLENVYISPERKKGLPIKDLNTAQITYLNRYNSCSIEQFLKIRNLEKELVTVANDLVDKYGNYYYQNGKRFYLNIDDDTVIQTRVRYEIYKLDDILSVTRLPDLKYKEKEKNKLSNNQEHATILHIEKGIVESYFGDTDLENLKTIFTLEGKNQNKNVAFIAPLVEKVLEIQKNSKISGKNYILEKSNKDLIIANSHQVELMKVNYSQNQWIIINSSLSDNDFYYFQKIKIMIENMEKSQLNEKAKLTLDLQKMI
ncbi:MAG: pentapeptide repeat-containing protein [Xenococcaceae cyanobacterium MO_188.B19]|nr:pentapeptide repeat-containing protein [Xenococcaceae cyanobacterium MO_188.B19]